ncbi:MAG: TIGR04222 domain-containing membrane protein [Oscillatoriales cyanobacterium SM2_1_8]|nr:TIGR04222 domain-containing membrane protein [Oscillatoriales cyanobacterium SM2_1_8]
MPLVCANPGQLRPSFFGEAPPTDIWANPQDRFDRHGQLVWVNTHQNWVVPKSMLAFTAGRSPKLLVLGLLIVLVLAMQGELNPLAFAGSPFLTFYGLLSVFAIAVASSLRRALRLPAGQPTDSTVSLDVYEAAYLAAGESRAVDTVVAGFIQKEWVTVQSDALVWQSPRADFSHPLEPAVAQAIAVDGAPEAVQGAVGPSLGTIRERLQTLGLLVKPAQARQAQLVPALAIASLLGLGAAKILVGLARGKPVGFLLLMSLGVALVSLFFALRPVHRSRWGDRVLRELQGPIAKTTLERADPQLPWAFALLGMAMLPDEGFGDWKKLLKPVPQTASSSASYGESDGSSDWGSGGDSGGDGDSGGGGCGGCSSD